MVEMKIKNKPAQIKRLERSMGVPSFLMYLIAATIAKKRILKNTYMTRYQPQTNPSKIPTKAQIPMYVTVFDFEFMGVCCLVSIIFALRLIILKHIISLSFAFFGVCFCV